jgi:pimeloyl-ACP methyl ester carboxylesterase
MLVQGWTESGVLKESLLKKVLESIPGVMVVIPEYLEKTATGKFAKFKTHLSIEAYAFNVKMCLEQIRRDYPDVPVMVAGHSLGGVITRHLHLRGLLSEENMILVGTPNMGITYKTMGGKAGIVVLPILKVLASKYLCDVPVLYQLLAGSEFLRELNKNGIPKRAHYISGYKDKVVPYWSSDPLATGEFVDCGHHLFPNEGKLADSSAIPIVERIVKERLAEIKAAASY